MYIIIAAIGKNNELGKNNDLIWHLPGDLRFFKETTMNKTLLMGKNTFDSLPKVLPGRKHIVLSFEDFNCDSDMVEIYTNKDEMMKKYDQSNEEIFISGGASMYKMFLPVCDKMYLTHINAEEKNADVYFPEFSEFDWQTKVVHEGEDNGISYKMVEYTRKK